jgi:hypothetical protein
MTEESKQDYRFTIIVSAIIITCYIALTIAIGWLLLEYGVFIREWIYSWLPGVTELPEDYPTGPDDIPMVGLEVIIAIYVVGFVFMAILIVWLLHDPETALISEEEAHSPP